ncbi:MULTISPECIES: hypothetical protein [unclassified Clostridium]|uniref:hypothetical protein n=1 Tax=unclassified Clostridium TaxID=2614128 RepID=UPI0025BD7D74|nr:MULTISPECIES: hypothetical protein [unclassified Clostridium]
MNYLDLYKKKLSNKGGNATEAIFNKTKYKISNDFKFSPAYKLGTLLKSDLTEESIDTRIVNVDRTVNDKKIYLLPDKIVSEGDYIQYPTKTYIVKEFEDNISSPCAISQYCNQTLNWEGLENPLPCRMYNDSFGTKLIANNEFLQETDAKAKIEVQRNKFTESIVPNMRFLFEHNKNGVYKVTGIDVAFNKNIIVLTTKKDDYRKEDDLENNIAYNEFLSKTEPLVEYKIIGSERININSKNEYRIEPNINCSWIISNEKVANIISKSNGSCVINAVKKNDFFTLTAKDKNGVELAKMNIFTGVR